MTTASAVSTEGRVFVAQLSRDLVARQAAGAGLLSPGAKTWEEAFKALVRGARGQSPIKTRRRIDAALLRLRQAQTSGACFVNGVSRRQRSALLEILTCEVRTHPLLDSGREGVAVRQHLILLRRAGKIEYFTGTCAYASWHALARMRERSSVDVFAAGGVVAMCGVVGLIMRESEAHRGQNVNLTIGDSEKSTGMICTGVLRTATNDIGQTTAFYDVLTVLPLDREQRPRQHDQGCRVADAVMRYVSGSDADPSGHADDVPVLPFHESDFVSREIRALIGEQ
jgi:hypothetical protein